MCNNISCEELLISLHQDETVSNFKYRGILIIIDLSYHTLRPITIDFIKT